MIISASRRTDIPAFYSKWFINRLNEGYLLIPNPYNANRISRVDLSPENVDCIVFWTKNPHLMIKSLDYIDNLGYKYYFQYTLNPYGSNIEKNLPDISKRIDTFTKLSGKTSPKQIVWRYDPIFIDENHTVDWHIKEFSSLCKKLSGYTERCIISFIDLYRNIRNRYSNVSIENMLMLGAEFSEISNEYKINLYTCSETVDLTKYGIKKGACIDKLLIEDIIESKIKTRLDSNQRTNCNCIESIDIGVYNTCFNDCDYCYANSSKSLINAQKHSYDLKSPMINGYPSGDEIINNRTQESSKINQLTMF